MAIISSNPLIGIGTGDVKDELMEVYRKHNMDKALDEHLNVHNQFLETAIQIGISGLLLLLTIFIWPLIHAIKNRNTLLFFFLVASGLFFFFESALNQQAGSFCFAFLLSFLLFLRPAKKEIILKTG